jgi:hypothetical protein
MLVGYLGTSVSLPHATVGGGSPALHAIGEIWSGSNADGWEAFDVPTTTNFTLADQVFIGTAEDLTSVYPARNTTFPTTVISSSFTGTQAITNMSSFLETRFRGMGNRLMWAQGIPFDLQAPEGSAPFDVIGRIGSGVDVPRAATLPGGLAIRALRQPARGPVLEFTVQASQAGRIRIDLFDASGRKVAPVDDRNVSPGLYRVSFTSPGLPPGTYFVRASLGAETARAKVIYLGR